MTKKRLLQTIHFLMFLSLLLAVAILFSYLSGNFGSFSQAIQDSKTSSQFTVILDAGHGGEDGGAVSAEGMMEKDLNLQIAKKVRDLLEANGTKVVMTRDTDILLYDRSSNYEGRKKAQDLAARRKIGEETENGIFVSIHMNAFPLTQYQGLQVWYSKNHPLSLELAETVQGTVQHYLQRENERQVKPATSGIYLLHHLQCPAILVECGFLSNPSEATLLCDESYQNELAFLIFLSISDALYKK